MESVRRRSLFSFLLLAVLLPAALVLAQGLPTATLGGKVTSEGAGLPGVTVTARSPNLQGARTAVTSANGDYAFNNMPPGDYSITFALASFQTARRDLRLAASQTVSLDVAMRLAGVTAEATVVASTEMISTGPQQATTYTADVLNTLPVTRTLLSAVALSPGVNQNGPNGAVTISGAQSFENLFTVNGAVVTDNIRVTPYALFIEDAIQETTTTSSTISAEYGRFTGGVVNTITKSGGNSFSGSFRTSLDNDGWSAVSPAGETRVDHLNPRYEATLGGPIWKDKIWFFGAGRFTDATGSGQTAFTLVSYQTADTERRYEGKLTLSPFQSHTLTGSYLRITRDLPNSNQDPEGFMDLDSLLNQKQPQELIAANYNGVLTNNLFLDGQYSHRKFTFEGSGSPFTDLVRGTNMRDLSRGGFGGPNYNSPTFCGVCDPEERANENFLARGTWFASTTSLGSHNIVFGYDNFSGKVTSNNYQSGSNYTIYSSGALLLPDSIYPVFEPDTVLVYWPIAELSQGSDLRTHSLFLNDTWKLNSRIAFNLGIRWDQNHAKDQGGVVRADDSAFSPRLSATADVTGNGDLRLTASYAQYVAAINENFVSAATPAGTPSILYWYYDGPPVNSSPTQPLVGRADAITGLFNWFFAQGCPNLATCQLPLAGAQVPGYTEKIVTSLDSPHTDEWVVGVGGELFGGKLSYRADGVYREYKDFYNGRRDTTTGTTADPFGNRYDVTLIENTDLLSRKYVGLHTQLGYRLGRRLNVGANWTWSHSYGNFDGETAASGPIKGGIQFYPEYFDRKWSQPTGDVGTDQRHRLRAFATFFAPLPESFGSLSFSVLHALDTGTPYGAAGLVSTLPYVTNPGYVTPPSSVVYYFTPRDAFRTDTINRTDIALNFSYRIAGVVELFVQPQVLNVFNNQGVFAVDTSVRTAFNAARFLPFNPFTETPVQGPRPAPGGTATTNWDYGPSFGQARSVADYQAPRLFRMSVGVRF